MRKKYGIFIVIIVILLAGSAVTLLNRLYSFDYLYNSIIKRDFAVNPRIEVNPEKEYEVRIWYYPFYRTVKDSDEKEFFELLKKEVNAIYPNIKLFIGEVNFATGNEKLRDAIKDGNPPDIYLNLTNQSIKDENLQIPVSPYISDVEKEGFYTVNWDKISHRDKLWGWPFIVYRQFWVTNNGLEIGKYQSQDFKRRISYLEKNSLLLNYYDEMLLRQLLTVVGLDTFKLEKNKLDIDSYRALEDVFYLLYRLRQNEIIYNSGDQMTDIFLKEFFGEESVVIGPVNPYLFNFINNKSNNKYSLLPLDNLIKTYKINVFRQKKYKGDDHTRAVMEVSRVISQRLSSVIAEDLNLADAYIPTMESENSDTQEILEISPEYREYWNAVVIPTWLDFWEKDLTPGEAVARLK